MRSGATALLWIGVAMSALGTGTTVSSAYASSTGPGALSARVSTTPDSTLTLEGGSFAAPIVQGALEQVGSSLAPINAVYNDTDLDSGRNDLTTGAADVAVSEVPLTNSELSSSPGVSYAYVPFAASSVDIGAMIMQTYTSGKTVQPDTFFSNVQVTPLQVEYLFGSGGPGIWSEFTDTQPGGGTISPVLGNTYAGHEIILPAASTLALEQYIVSDPKAKAAYDKYLNSLKVPSDTPQDVWPIHQGYNGGDLTMAQNLVPLDPTANPPAPYPDPNTWSSDSSDPGQNNSLNWGNVGPIPVSYAGPPRNIPTVNPENAAGAFVAPTPASETAALNDATYDSSTGLVTFQGPNYATDKAAYPMMEMSYLVVPKSGLSGQKAAAVAKVIDYLLGSKGQAMVQSFGAVVPTQQMITAGLQVATTLQGQGAGSGGSGTNGGGGRPLANATNNTTPVATPNQASTGGTGSTVGPSNSPGGGTSALDSSSSSGASNDSSSPGSVLAFTGGIPEVPAGAGLFLAGLGLLGRKTLRRRAKGTPFHPVVRGGAGNG